MCDYVSILNAMWCHFPQYIYMNLKLKTFESLGKSLNMFAHLSRKFYVSTFDVNTLQCMFMQIRIFLIEIMFCTILKLQFIAAICACVYVYPVNTNICTRDNWRSVHGKELQFENTSMYTNKNCIVSWEHRNEIFLIYEEYVLSQVTIYSSPCPFTCLLFIEKKFIKITKFRGCLEQMKMYDTHICAFLFARRFHKEFPIVFTKCSIFTT